jgi:hypothetical protein
VDDQHIQWWCRKCNFARRGDPSDQGRPSRAGGEAREPDGEPRPYRHLMAAGGVASGAVVSLPGAMLGGWLLSWARGDWLPLVVGAFLVSNAMRYRLGDRVRSFPMKLPYFIPVSVVVGLVSGLIGASSLISLPFYHSCQQ